MLTCTQTSTPGSEERSLFSDVGGAGTFHCLRRPPEAYRAKWGLKPDYPMVAPSYAARHQELAKKIGLGRKPRTLKSAPEPAKMRSRKKTAA